MKLQYVIWSGIRSMARSLGMYYFQCEPICGELDVVNFVNLFLMNLGPFGQSTVATMAGVCNLV